MFNKLISNIAINPSHLNQLSFYAKRLKKEESIRRIGFVFIILSMFVQIGASMFPAERSLAASSNDVIYGGVSSKADLVSKCNNNAQVRGIYAKFGVTCAEINASTTKLTTVNSSGNYWSMGRTPLSNHGINGDDWGERTFSAGGTAVYHRPLKAWGSGVNYEAFSIKSGSKTYWILKNCGNLTTIGPEGPTPDLEVHKKLLSPASVKPGDEVKFQLTYRNTVSESVAVDFRLRDLVDNNTLEDIKMSGMNNTYDGDPARDQKGLEYTPTLKESIVVAKVKASVANGTRICNTANASADVVGVKTSNEVCFTVKVSAPTPETPTTPIQPCPYNAGLKANDPNCKPPTPEQPCPYNQTLKANDPKCVQTASGFCVVSTSFIGDSNKDIKVSTEASIEGNTKVESYSYDLDVDGKIDATTQTSSLTDSKEFKNLPKGTHRIQVMVNFANGTQKLSKTCVAEIDIAEDPKLVQSKQVIDEKGNNLEGKKISSGDKLQFKLVTKNITSTNSGSYSGEDYFGDVLEYAEISDIKELEKQDITLGKDNYLRWTTSSIKGNSEDIKTISVKVKSIVPSTNRPVSTGTDQDCVISNKYGNQVSININCPIIKRIETTTTKLPDTGPGTTVGLAFVVTVLAGYFLARSRLLNKEARIVRNMYQQSI